MSVMCKNCLIVDKLSRHHTHIHTQYIYNIYIYTHTNIENDGNQIKLEISYLETGDMVLLYSTKNFVT